MNERSDSSLVAASRRGDREAFGCLVHRHRGRIFALCLAMLGNQEDAEDAAQEVFVKSLGQLDTLRDGTNYPRWVMQIARNRCRDLLRQRGRRPMISLAEAPPMPAASPAVSTDEFLDIQSALDQLAEEHRLPLMLFYYDGRSVRRLAEELELTEGGACARLYRARKALRKILKEREAKHA